MPVLCSRGEDAPWPSRKIAGVSIANPRRIMKKVARARAYASLHCSDGLKDESMKTPSNITIQAGLT